MIDYKTNPMNKEIYSDNINVQCLEHGTIDGFNYYIISYSSHPCGYVEIPKGHPFFEMRYEDVQWKHGIYAHGGLTYGEDSLLNLKDSWFIGWDYAHSGDFYNVDYRPSYGAKHTLDEIREEARSVIQQIINYRGE